MTTSSAFTSAISKSQESHRTDIGALVIDLTRSLPDILARAVCTQYSFVPNPFLAGSCLDVSRFLCFYWRRMSTSSPEMMQSGIWVR